MSRSTAQRLRDPPSARDPRYASGRASKNSSEERSQPDRRNRSREGLYGIRQMPLTLAEEKEAREQLYNSEPPSRDTSADTRNSAQRGRKPGRRQRNKSGAKSNANTVAQIDTAAPTGSISHPLPTEATTALAASEDGGIVAVEPLVEPSDHMPTTSTAAEDVLPSYPPLESDFESASEYDIQGLSSDEDSILGVYDDEDGAGDLSVVVEDEDGLDEFQDEEELDVPIGLLDTYDIDGNDG